MMYQRLFKRGVKPKWTKIWVLLPWLGCSTRFALAMLLSSCCSRGFVSLMFVPPTYSKSKANVFTVWRPTSEEAIKNMMLGIATGKGLDIKGKSAKKGNIR